MKRMILLLSLLLFFVAPVYAETCVTIKPGIAIDNVDDYKNMVFTSLAGEEATVQLAAALMNQGKCIFLGAGEKLDIEKEYGGIGFFKRNGKVWLIPKSVLRCK